MPRKSLVTLDATILTQLSAKFLFCCMVEKKLGWCLAFQSFKKKVFVSYYEPQLEATISYILLLLHLMVVIDSYKSLR